MKKCFLLPKALILFFLVVLTACASNKGVTTLAKDGFAAKIENRSVILVDVRTADEWSTGYIPGAINIDVTKTDFAEKARELLPVNKEIAVYCRSGVRGKMASKKLAKMGYKVYNLKKGFMSWEGAVIVPETAE